MQKWPNEIFAIEDILCEYAHNLVVLFLTKSNNALNEGLSLR